MDLIVVGGGRLSRSYFENVFQLPAVGLLSETAAYELVRRGERELIQSGLFDVSETGLDLNVRKSSAGRYELVLNVEGKVKRILTAKAEGNVQGRLGGTGLNGVVELAFRSPFGLGEKISFEQGCNQHGEPTATWSVYHPFLIPQSDVFGDRSFKMSFSRSFEDRIHMQSIFAKQTALCIDLIPKVENGLTISAGALLGDANPTSSVKLQECSASAGLLSAFAAHSKVYVSMGKLLQTKGGHVGCSLEIALPGGASRFLKSELFGLSRWSLGSLMGLEPSTPLGQYCHRVSASVAGAGGVIVPLSILQRNATLRPPSLMDRFYLGGPNSIRGFESLGLGPRSLAPHSGDRGDAVGGIGKLSAVVILQLPCPTLPKHARYNEFLQTCDSSRLFFALSGGWLQSPHSWQSRQSQLFSAMSSEVRVSASIGVTLPLPHMGGELTLTYSLPLKAASSDVLKHWQLGFSIN